jgi:hypothetical protein
MDQEPPEEVTTAMWLIVNVAALIVVLVVVVVVSFRPAERGYIPGLLVIGAGFVVATLLDLRIIPAESSRVTRIAGLGLGIVGLVLMERVWAAKRSSQGRPS